MRSGGVCLNCTRFLGYDKDKNGRLVVVESEAIIVRKIFELYLNGFGVRKIKKYLEENGIKNKPSFTNDDSLRKIFYIASKNIASHWSVTCRNWDMVSNQLSIMFADRNPA